jgi:uncharacterized membrane protein
VALEIKDKETSRKRVRNTQAEKCPETSRSFYSIFAIILWLGIFSLFILIPIVIIATLAIIAITILVAVLVLIAVIALLLDIHVMPTLVSNSSFHLISNMSTRDRATALLAARGSMRWTRLSVFLAVLAVYDFLVMPTLVSNSSCHLS